MRLAGLAVVVVVVVGVEGWHNASLPTYADKEGIPGGLVTFAGLFDVVMILCYGDTCDGQLEAWPSKVRERVCVANAKELYNAYDQAKIAEWQEDHNHGRLVTLGYAAGLRSCRERFPQGTKMTYLVLEGDFQWLDRTYDPAKIGAFLSGDRHWDVIRFGYCPRPWVVFISPDGSPLPYKDQSVPDDTLCRTECLSEVIDDTDNGSIVHMAPKGCKIYSAIAQAFSDETVQTLIDFGEALLHQTNQAHYLIDLLFTSHESLKDVSYFPRLFTDPSKRHDCNATWSTFMDLCT